MNAESTTQRETWLEERIMGDEHYVTRIWNDQDSVEGRGRTAEEAEATASQKWTDLGYD
ncbi:hypothetical protein KAX17_07130 [Candidatus Bipolaricaulota bacterium]|nr:hypothetical protein [Candidatus Bipolaricaulota bacterium]